MKDAALCFSRQSSWHSDANAFGSRPSPSRLPIHAFGFLRPLLFIFFVHPSSKKSSPSLPFFCRRGKQEMIGNRRGRPARSTLNSSPPFIQVFAYRVDVDVGGTLRVALPPPSPLCRRFSEGVLLPNCSRDHERNWNKVGSLFKTSASEFVAASSMMRQNSDGKKGGRRLYGCSRRRRLPRK